MSDKKRAIKTSDKFKLVESTGRTQKVMIYLPKTHTNSKIHLKRKNIR